MKNQPAGTGLTNVLLIIANVLLLVLLISNLVIASKITGDSAPTPSQPSAPSAPGAPTRVEASADDDPVMGDDDAEVTIIEFSDFQCPFCGRFYTETLPLIKTNYIDTGKAKLVYRDFPLGFHQNAQKAAEASECADEQSKYWEYHDVLFKNQNALDDASLKKYAVDLKLNTAQFNTCLDSGKYASEVQKDYAAGSAAGVTGTPSFVVNGQLIVGAQPYAIFQQAIDAALAE